MKRPFACIVAALAFAAVLFGVQPTRLVILKVDGLNDDLLQATMREIDPATGKSRLPWLTHIFEENGTIFDNFYVRGISLSAPSWQMLDTGRHTVIRGNVEFDRYTGQPYDYLNFIPFYLGYARERQVDMPGVEVLDRAGIPLLIDGYAFSQYYQSFQLYQRGVRWQTLTDVLKRRFSANAILSTVESAGAPSYASLMERQMESDLEHKLEDQNVLYLDFFNGDVDHEGHASSGPALFESLKELDSSAGRIWTAIQHTPLAKDTVFVMVSDHGMNNRPGIISQTFSLPDLFNSAEGGGHHVVTNRQQLSDFKLKALDPLISRVVTPSMASFYLSREANHYPTAWLDIDGNERTSVHLRNSDLNKIHILLEELGRADLSPELRRGAAEAVRRTIDTHRAEWSRTADELDQEMDALKDAIAERKKLLLTLPPARGHEAFLTGEDKANRRSHRQLGEWEEEHSNYCNYLEHLRRLLAFVPSSVAPFKGKISDLVPEMALGENNSIAQIQHYVVGLSLYGLTLDSSGKLDAERSFRFVNYPELLCRQRARNVPQKELSARPIDFVAAVLPDPAPGQHAYWLFGDAGSQLVVRTDAAGRISALPVQALSEDADGTVHSVPQQWRAGLPLGLFEDADVKIPDGADRGTWLSAWHTEREWLEAVHRARYSNGIIGITEELSPVALNVPGTTPANAVLLRYEKRRRQLVQTDFHIFATDHWNFNVRFPNPGGNHGSFLRISTHSVWMMAGKGVPVRHVIEPYDSLNFASTVMSIIGRPTPMPERVVDLR